MIAANYRKYPQAMALQWPLPFGRVQVWALPRPTTRILRKIRALRGAAFKQIGRIVYPEKKTVPTWAKTASKKVRELGKAVKEACMRLDFGKQKTSAEELATMNPYRRMVVRAREAREAC